MYRMSNKIRTAVAAILTSLALSANAYTYNYTCVFIEVADVTTDTSADVPTENIEPFNIYYKYPSILMDNTGTWSYYKKDKIFYKDGTALVVKNLSNDKFEIYVMSEKNTSKVAKGNCFKQ